MRLGVENRKKALAALGLFALAVFLLWRTFSSGAPALASKTPAPAQVANAAGAARATTAMRTRRGRARSATPPAATEVTASLDPRLRLDLLKASEGTDYEGSGRNIFDAQSEIQIPTPVGNGRKEDRADNTPPAPPPGPKGPPPPPPINLKFFGFASRAGEPKKVFLSQGEDVFIATEGDIVSRRYKVVKINNNSVEIEDLLSNNTQTIPLTAG